MDEAFPKILNTFEKTPSTKIKIPGQAAIDVPMTFSDDAVVTFETTVLLDLNEETKKALKHASKDPAAARVLFKNDVDCELIVE
jgi:hypothetical protein